MRRYSSFVVFLFLVVFSQGSFAADLNDQTAADVAKRFGAEIQCGPASQDVWKAWCPVTSIGKGSFTPPSTPTTLVGLSMSLHQNAKVIPALQQTMDLAVLTVGPNTARITDLRPSNDDEKKELLDLLMKLTDTLKGKSGKSPIPVSSNLEGFLKGENSKPGNAMKIDKAGASFSAKLPSRLYKVTGQSYGDAYISLEQAGDGIAVSIYPTVGFKSK